MQKVCRPCFLNGIILYPMNCTNGNLRVSLKCTMYVSVGLHVSLVKTVSCELHKPDMHVDLMYDSYNCSLHTKQYHACRMINNKQ